MKSPFVGFYRHLKRINESRLTKGYTTSSKIGKHTILREENVERTCRKYGFSWKVKLTEILFIVEKHKRKTTGTKWSDCRKIFIPRKLNNFWKD